jgi:rare lipoprotein A
MTPPPPVAVAPVPEPPPMRDAPPSEPPPISMAAAPPPQPMAGPQHYWPSLIAPAHAETFPSAGALSARAGAIPVAASGRIFVQAGAFAVAENAQRVRARIATLGTVQIVPAAVNGTALYRVRLGPVTNEAEADRLLSKVVGSGYPTARIVSE